MKRILCLDYGTNRIGVSISDPLGITSQPLNYLENNKAIINNIERLHNDLDFNDIILGLPLNSDGKETKMSKLVKEFGKELESRLKIKVKYVDERYSSKAVEKNLINANISRKKRKELIDSQAAAFILQGYLNKYNQNL